MNTLDLQGNASSENIQQSKKNGVLISIYKISYIDSSFRNYISNHLLNQDSFEFWIEHEWHLKPKYIFFNPTQITDKIQILSKSILAKNKCLSFSFSELNSANYSNICTSNSLQVIDSIPEKVKIYSYEYPSEVIKFIGTLEIIRDKSFPSSFHEKITWKDFRFLP